jgi:histidine triad (HIT) family protein
MNEDCVFCKIVNGQIPSDKVSESQTSIAFNSIEPVAEHHILVIPKTHVPTFLDFETRHKDIFIDMVTLAQQVIKARKIDGGYKIAFNGGKYQVVPHVHMHILGGKINQGAVDQT